jgi:hypothetical protein
MMAAALVCVARYNHIRHHIVNSNAFFAEGILKKILEE